MLSPVGVSACSGTGSATHTATTSHTLTATTGVTLAPTTTVPVDLGSLLFAPVGFAPDPAAPPPSGPVTSANLDRVAGSAATGDYLRQQGFVRGYTKSFQRSGPSEVVLVSLQAFEFESPHGAAAGDYSMTIGLHGRSLDRSGPEASGSHASSWPMTARVETRQPLPGRDVRCGWWTAWGDWQGARCSA